MRSAAMGGSSADDSLHLSGLSDMSTVDMRKVAELVRRLAQSRLEARRLQNLLPATSPAPATAHSDTVNDSTRVAAPSTAESRASGPTAPPGTFVPPVLPTTALGTAADAADGTPQRDTAAPRARPAHRHARAEPANTSTHSSQSTSRQDRHWKQRYAAVKAQLRAEREKQEAELHDIFALVESITSEADQTRLRGENARLQRQVLQLLHATTASANASAASSAVTPTKPPAASAAALVDPSPSHAPPTRQDASAVEQRLSPRRPLLAPHDNDRLSLSLTSASERRVAEDALTSFLMKEIEVWRQRCLALEQTRPPSVPPESPGRVRPPEATMDTPAPVAPARVDAPSHGPDDGLNCSALPPPSAAPVVAPALVPSPTGPAKAATATTHLDLFPAPSLPGPGPALDPFMRAEQEQAERVQHELRDQRRHHPHVPTGLTADYAAGSPHWQPQVSRIRSPHRSSPARRTRMSHPAKPAVRTADGPRHRDRRSDHHRRRPVSSKSSSSSSSSATSAQSITTASSTTPSSRPARARDHTRRRRAPATGRHRRLPSKEGSLYATDGAPSSSSSVATSSSRSSSAAASSEMRDHTRDHRRGVRDRHTRRSHDRRARSRGDDGGGGADVRHRRHVKPQQSGTDKVHEKAPTDARTQAVPPPPPFVNPATVPYPYLWYASVPPSAYANMPPPPPPPPAGVEHEAHRTTTPGPPASPYAWYAGWGATAGPTHPLSATGSVPPPLPPPPSSGTHEVARDGHANIYQDLLHLPLFAGPPPPVAPTLFATPYRPTLSPSTLPEATRPAPPEFPACTHAPPPSADAAARPPPWRVTAVKPAVETVAAPPVPPLPSARARLARDIRRHDELLAAISTLQSAAAEEAFQRP